MITFANAERCHRRMWDWLAKTGDKRKVIGRSFMTRINMGIQSLSQKIIVLHVK